MKKSFTLFIILLASQASFAGKKYWKQVSQRQHLSASSLVFLDAAFTQSVSFISSSDTLYFVANSFTGSQEDTIEVVGNQSVSMMDFTDISGLTHRPLLLIPSVNALTISQNPSLANIRLAIEGTLNITCDNVGSTYVMSTPNTTIFSDLGTGIVNFDFGPNGGATNLTLLKDFIAENVSIHFKGGRVNVNGKKIKCKDFDAQSGPFNNNVNIDFTLNSSVETTGHFKINHSSSNVTFATQTKIILNSNGLALGNNYYLFDCPSSSFQGTDLELLNNAKYAFLINSVNHGTLKLNNVSLGRNSQVLFGASDTLAFNVISTTSKGQDFTTISGGNNTPPNRSVLQDLDGGNNCLYHTKPQQLTMIGGNAYLFGADSSSNNINTPNIGFTFRDDVGRAVYSANNLPVTASAVELYKINISLPTVKLIKVDSVTTDALGRYKLNSGLFKATTAYVLSITPNVQNHPTLIPSYYKKINGKDSAVFSWKNAGAYIGLSCGSVIDDTIHVIERLPANGQGKITGQITEGRCFGCRVMSPSAQGGPVKGVKVGLGKNPPGSIIAFTSTDDNGDYTFSGLPDGNYTVYADIPGLNLTGTHSVTVAGGSTVTTQDFVADSATIEPINLSTAIKNLQGTASENSFSIYPNPFNGTLYLNFGDILVNTTFHMELIDVLGKIVFSTSELIVPSKSFIKQINFNKEAFKPGLYMLKTQYNNQIQTTRLVRE